MISPMNPSVFEVMQITLAPCIYLQQCNFTLKEASKAKWISSAAIKHTVKGTTERVPGFVVPHRLQSSLKHVHSNDSR